MASAHRAHLAEAIKGLVDVSVAANESAVEAALTAVEQRVSDIEPRRSIPFADTMAVSQRDCWTCRYCGGQTIAPPVLRVLSRLHPERFPYHRNWKAGQVHPACLLLSTTLDHVVPAAAAALGVSAKTS